jgi:hypothetical protein
MTRAGGIAATPEHIPDGAAQKSPRLNLEVRCIGCDTHQTVALDIIRRPKKTPIHELERYMRCKDCSDVRGYPYKRSHLIALRTTKISASDPPSHWLSGRGEPLKHNAAQAEYVHLAALLLYWVAQIPQQPVVRQFF